MTKRYLSEITNKIKNTIMNYEENIFSINDIRRDCDVSYYTAKKHLKFLRELGYIEGKNTFFRRL
ncbi:MAG: hypothetical protein ACOCUI_01850 [bacterium]